MNIAEDAVSKIKKGAFLTVKAAIPGTVYLIINVSEKAKFLWA